MVKRDDVQCREKPSASISCDFRKGSDVVLEEKREFHSQSPVETNSIKYFAYLTNNKH